MKSKTLSKITWYAFFIFVVAIILIVAGFGKSFLSQFVPIEWVVALCGFSGFLLIYLIGVRIISCGSLSVSKGWSLFNLMYSYRSSYIFLTDEARLEWRNYIAHERERLKKNNLLNNQSGGIK